LEAVETRRFSTDEINLARSVADQVAGALARAQFNAERQRLGAAIEQTAESVIITDTEGTIVYVNPAFELVTGYHRAEVIGRNPSLLNSGEQDAAFYQELWSTINTGKVWHGRFVNKRKDDTLYTADTTITPVRNGNRAIVNYVAVSRDVTRELQLEEQYRQAQKMEAVGLLAGGIAHDFNNLLTAINGFAELMQFQLTPDDSLYELAGKILGSGRRAASLTRQLLAFSRKQLIEPKVLNINSVVAEIEKMLKRIIGEHIQMETTLAPDLWPAKVDPAQFEQVVVNLAVNARDAMPEGGRLTIATANVVLDEEFVAEHVEMEPGEYVLLSVSDTGMGMSSEVKAHLFEPFFTTKRLGEGTGLGLATVHGIVKQSGGHIWVESEEGRGTIFTIYLPRTHDAKSALAYSKVEADVPSGSETILLVEDDPQVRELAHRVLQEQGYTVLEASNGEEALELLTSHTGPIDLLLTDVVMPGMSGKALADQLLRTQPDLRAIFMSGYTDEAIAHHGVLDPDVAFLQKPFSPTILARKVRDVLDD
ncbi:MAG: ATP-binding protein, partial [Planctomycetota bacterium]